MPTSVYDSSALTKRKQDKMIANSFLSRIQGQPCNTGSASYLGISQQSVINEVRMGQIPLIRRNEGGCTTVELGCPCQGPALVSGPVIPDTEWNLFGNAFNDLNFPVIAFAIDPTNGDVYVGGSFTTAGGTTVNNIAKWDGTTWSALNGGTNAPVFALLLVGTTLYVGGNFNGVGTFPYLVGTQYLAAYDTVAGTWSTVGANPINNGAVYSLTNIGTTLYVGGIFTTAPASNYNRIAAFNTSTNTWSSLNTGLDNAVYTLITDGTTLYVGGQFVATQGGALTLNRVAAWNPSTSTWSALGAGFPSGYLRSLTLFNGALYAGHLNLGVNVWNGVTWSSVGPSGTFTNTGEVLALTSSGSNLYAGGNFTTPASNIAVWNGSSWSAVGNGTAAPGQVNALTVAVQGGFTYLYVGGNFTQVGPPPLPSLSADYIATYGPI